jgi:hypothetical protein
VIDAIGRRGRFSTCRPKPFDGVADAIKRASRQRRAGLMFR